MIQGSILLLGGLCVGLVLVLLIKNTQWFGTIHQLILDREQTKKGVLAQYPPEVADHYTHTWQPGRDPDSIINKPLDPAHADIGRRIRAERPGIFSTKLSPAKVLIGFACYGLLLALTIGGMTLGLLRMVSAWVD